MPWSPSEPGEIPTLGWEVIDWIVDNLAAPDNSEYEPFIPTREQAEFILRFYALDPRTGRRKIRRGVISRPRGWGKSPFLAAIGIVEALGPVLFDGWNAEGQPVGKPWSTVRTPFVKLAAVSETQTQNSWAPLLEMLAGPVMDNYPGLEPLGTFVNLPRGKIEPVTSSASSVKGNKPVFCLLDQTEEWTKSNGGIRLAETLRINAAKLGGSSIESPNAFIPGMGSVAEASAEYYKALIEGRARDDGLLYDHREAPPDTDLTDRDSLLTGLRYVYGESAQPNGWVDLDRIVAEIWDPDIDPQTARADFLNQITHASDAWLSHQEWASSADPLTVVADKDAICLGFDGSRHRARGITDATALVACRVEDGHLFLIHCWEQPDGPLGEDWWVPTQEVNAVIAETFRRYSVVGFYADPAADWRSFVAEWEAAHGNELRVQSTRDHPIEWWMGGNNTLKSVRATEQFHSAVVHKNLSHDGGSTLTRHVLNARRRPGRSGIQIAKPHPDSPHKIDAAVAAILAWQCRVDALSTGIVARERRASRKLYRF